jgi:PKD repeat protein
MMKKQLVSILFILFCLYPVFLKAQADQACHYSTEGTDFWFGFMENRLSGNTHYLEITITSRVNAEVTLTYGPNEIFIIKKNVGANQSTTISIDPSLLEPSGSEMTEDKGIHLISDFPVNVYALNYRTQSSDVAVIYPTNSLGKEYLAMCYSPNISGGRESNSEFVIVATRDNTTVQITPSVDTDKGNKAKVKYTVPLKKGQLYQVQSMNKSSANQGDLTGSLIVSNEPIAFYSGVKATPVPYEGSSYDHLYEQIPPTSSWGREFYVVPLESRIKDTYRILAAEDNTIVTIEGINLKVTLNKGDFKEFELTKSQVCRIISTKRVLLAQYCRSQLVDEPNGVGDPFMIIISPVVQKINDVTFEAYRSPKITDIFYVNIITKTSEVNEITLDGRDITSYFKPFPDGIYSYAQVPVTSGTHRLKSNLQDGGFLAFVYGFGSKGSTESYGYGVGFNLDIQLDLGGSLADKTIVICRGEQRKLDAGDYFTTYEWSTGETGSSILVSTEGMFKVKASTQLGCIKMDSVYVKVDDTTVDLGEDRGTCVPGEIILDAKPGFAKYQWQDGSAGETFVVEKTGTYSVIVTNENGCSVSDEVEITVYEPLFTQDYKIATDQHPDITFTNETQFASNYLWDFGDGQTSTEESPTHHYQEVGEYTVTLKAIFQFGCTLSKSSTVKIIPFNLHTPNAFRPDSEIEKNRVFLPVSEGVDSSRYQLHIYSRTGSVIFESTDKSVGWDGRKPNGSNASPGIYVWKVSYTDMQGFQHQQNGTVMLVR